MISRIKMNHFDLMKWLKTFLKLNWLTVEFQSTDEKSIVHWKVKLWLFDQNQVSKVTIHQDMSKYEKISSRNWKVKIHLWKVKIPILRIFCKCWKVHFFHNFVPNFHHDARWFKGNSLHEICISQWDIKHCRE